MDGWFLVYDPLSPWSRWAVGVLEEASRGRLVGVSAHAPVVAPVPRTRRVLVRVHGERCTGYGLFAATVRVVGLLGLRGLAGAGFAAAAALVVSSLFGRSTRADEPAKRSSARAA